MDYKAIIKLASDFEKAAQQESDKQFERAKHFLDYLESAIASLPQLQSIKDINNKIKNNDISDEEVLSFVHKLKVSGLLNTIDVFDYIKQISK